MIDIHDFFDIDENGIPVKKPINRNAFTKEDVAYKIKVIKAMQDLGMEVTIDAIGNICGTFPGKLRTDKSNIAGSHTDSVDNGGQFDGPLGVYAALKATENLVKNGKNKTNLINHKVIVYACEESTRFQGKACLGSKFLRGDNLDFDNIKSREGLSLRECVAEFKAELFKQAKEAGLKPIKEVDKVIQPDEIVTAIEGHIEQADTLKDSGKSIGICTSITGPYRLKTTDVTTDIKTAAKFACSLNESARNPENFTNFRITVPKFSFESKTKEDDLKGKKVFTIRALGEQNHSGSTPMEKRKDPVYGAAKFIELVSNHPDIEVLETYTPKCGFNQINKYCDIKLAIDEKEFGQNISHFLLAQRTAGQIANITFEDRDDIIKEPFKDPENPTDDEKPGLYIDIRQQIGMEPELTGDMIFDCVKDIVHTTKSSVRMNVTSKGKAYRTNSDLVDSAVEICKENNIPYEVLASWAGHDSATLTHDELARIILIFCASSGGSHNPDETTTLDSIEKLVEVISSLSERELNRANKLYLEKTYASLSQDLEHVKNLSKELNISVENPNNLVERI